ncbi:rRNA methyltransferase 2, mitochondrial [Nowakowskiella sp. JEL0407]|nr:rRNA methyltransferase 2, mitochondrial [Nowakowskiella sp. JEL0407]
MASTLTSSSSSDVSDDTPIHPPAEQTSTTDVVYLDIRNSKFRVPAAILGMFPDTFLMTMFPAGVIPFFSISCPDPPPLPPLRGSVPRPSSRARNHSLPMEVGEEDILYPTNSTKPEESDVSSSPTKYESTELYYYQAFGRGYYDLEFPATNLNEPLDDIDDSKMVTVQNFDPKMFRFLVEHFRRVLAVNADRNRMAEAQRLEKIELQNGFEDGASDDALISVEKLDNIPSDVAEEKPEVPPAEPVNEEEKKTKSEESESQSGKTLKNKWRRKSKKPRFFSGLKKTFSQIFSISSVTKEGGPPQTVDLLPPVPPKSLSDHKKMMANAIQSILVLREEVDFYIFPGNIVLDEERFSSLDRTEVNTRLWPKLFKWRTNISKTKSGSDYPASANIPTEISDSSLRTNATVLSALKAYCATKLMSESKIGHQYAVPALMAATSPPSALPSTRASSRASFTQSDDMLHKKLQRKSFGRFSSIIADDDRKSRSSREISRFSKDTRRSSFDNATRSAPSSARNSQELNRPRASSISSTQKPDLADLLEPAENPESAQQTKILSQNKVFQQYQHLQLLSSLTTLTDFNPFASEWQYRELETNKSRLVSLSLLAMRDNQESEFLSRDQSHQELLKSLKRKWLDGAVGDDDEVTNPNVKERTQEFVRDEFGSVSAKPVPSIITSVADNMSMNSSVSIAENITDRRSVRRCWWEVLHLKIDVDELDNLVRKQIEALMNADDSGNGSGDEDGEGKVTPSKDSFEVRPSMEKMRMGASLEVKVWLRRTWMVDSQKWFERQRNDPYCRNRTSHGYVSRSAFKLEELNLQHKVIKFGDIVVDLGASPGGWSQVAAKIACPVTSPDEKLSRKPSGLVISVDIKNDIIPIHNTEAVIGDACSPIIQNQIFDIVAKHMNKQSSPDKATESLSHRGKVDVVLSDMAHSFYGNRTADVYKMDELSRTAFEIAKVLLKQKGSFVCKVLTGDSSQGRN